MRIRIAMLVLAASCAKESEEQSGGAAELARLRSLGAAYFEEERFDPAREVLSKVIEGPNAAPQEMVNLACVEMMAPNADEAKATKLLQDALVKDPNLVTAMYCLGILAKRNGRAEEALQQFQKLAALVPQDVATRWHLAQCLEDLDRTEEAEKQYQAIMDLGPENAGGYYPTSVYRLFQINIRSEDPTKQARGRELMALHKSLEEKGIKSPGARDQEMGALGRVKPPAPPKHETPRVAKPAEMRFEVVEKELAAEAGAVVSFVVGDLDHDLKEDLLAVGKNGVFAARQKDGAKFAVESVVSGEWERAVLADLDNDGLCSILLLGAKGVLLVALKKEGGWSDDTASLGTNLKFHDVSFVDIDHEGDLDLVAATDGGLRSWRNDGPQVFVETTADSKLPSGAFRWVQVEDFDADDDIDVLAGGGAAGTVLLSSLRKHRFDEWSAERTKLPATIEAEPVLEDLDQDGFVDVILMGANPGLCRGKGDGTFEPIRPLKPLDILAQSLAARLVDVNLDGELDLIAGQKDATSAVRFGSLLASTTSEGTLPASGTALSAVEVSDLDGDGDPELVGVDKVGLMVLRGDSGFGKSLHLILTGIKDNKNARGAVVELRRGDKYERHLWKGQHRLFGLEKAEKPDVVRVSWPNGVKQNLVEPDSSKPLEVRQKEGQVGSCPFLYTWNGNRFEFVSDVIGVTPLGLPMEEGKYVPPDHDELVRIEGRQLRPRDGEYVLQITEELREVTFLDRAQLWVVDHAADVEVHPEERFTFPPFPPQKLHTVRGALNVQHALGSDGRDWTQEIACIDGEHAAPFELVPAQFQGLVTPHTLTLTLPPEVRSAKKVRLLMTGWLFWTDASVNVAAGRDARYEFVPPILAVPDEHGNWKDAGPPVGFPAGKTKTMVLDVTQMLNREDPRIRLFSTIRLYWDCIRVAVDDDDAPIRVTKLEPSSANLYFRGFSRPIRSVIGDGVDLRHDHSDRFEFDELLDFSPWNQHSGMLTRYGDVNPLLQNVDDQFAIFSSGDAVEIRFRDSVRPLPDDAKDAARTYLLYLDGWAKDGDPNTEFAQTVEPLPFHGMSGYPYRSNESFPEDGVHLSYRQEWNTRPGQKLIPDLRHSRCAVTR